MSITDASRPEASFRARLPVAGKALLVFWAVIGLSVSGTAGVLAWLGPLPKAPPTRHVAVPAPVKPAVALSTPHSPVAPLHPAAPLPPITGPHLALLLGGFGYSERLTAAALARLPPQVAFLVSPYLPGLPALIAQARRDGHELYLNLPVQGPAPDERSAGPHALGYGNTADQDMTALDWSLGRAPGVIGISVADPLPHEGVAAPGFAATPDFPPVARAIDRKGLMVLVNGPERSGLPRDLRASDALNLDTDAASLDATLAALSRRALNGEYVLAVTNTVTPIGLERLAAWCDGLKSAGVTLVAPSRMLTSDTRTLPPSSPEPIFVPSPPLPPTLDQPS